MEKIEICRAVISFVGWPKVLLTTRYLSRSTHARSSRFCRSLEVTCWWEFPHLSRFNESNDSTDGEKYIGDRGYIFRTPSEFFVKSELHCNIEIDWGSVKNHIESYSCAHSFAHGKKYRHYLVLFREIVVGEAPLPYPAKYSKKRCSIKYWSDEIFIFSIESSTTSFVLKIRASNIVWINLQINNSLILITSYFSNCKWNRNTLKLVLSFSAETKNCRSFKFESGFNWFPDWFLRSWDQSARTCWRWTNSLR